MVIKEAQRAYAYLNLYGYAVDSVVCNRVFPQELQDAYFSGWLQAQQRNLAFVEEAFQPLPISRIPFFEEEVLGQKMLQRMAATLFGDDLERGGAGDPTRLYYQGEPQRVFARDGHYILSIAPASGRQRRGEPAPQCRRRADRPHRQLEAQYRPALGLARLKVDGANTKATA